MKLRLTSAPCGSWSYHMLKQKSLGLHENVEVEKQRRTSTFHFNSVKYYSNRWQHMALKKKNSAWRSLSLSSISAHSGKCEWIKTKRLLYFTTDHFLTLFFSGTPKGFSVKYELMSGNTGEHQKVSAAKLSPGNHRLICTLSDGIRLRLVWVYCDTVTPRSSVSSWLCIFSGSIAPPALGPHTLLEWSSPWSSLDPEPPCFC